MEKVIILHKSLHYFPHNIFFLHFKDYNIECLRRCFIILKGIPFSEHYCFGVLPLENTKFIFSLNSPKQNASPAIERVRER